MASQRSVSDSSTSSFMKTMQRPKLVRQFSRPQKKKLSKVGAENEKENGPGTTIPSSERRVLNQIQNTIAKSTSKDGAGLVDVEKKKIDDAAKSKNEPLAVVKETTAKFPSSDLSYLDDLDVDAPIEACGCSNYDAKPLDYDANDFLPPEERLSSFGPRFWDRYLRCIDFDDKENIFQFFDEREEDGEVDGVERDLAGLELQKLPMLD